MLLYLPLYKHKSSYIYVQQRFYEPSATFISLGRISMMLKRHAGVIDLFVMSHLHEVNNIYRMN